MICWADTALLNLNIMPYRRRSGYRRRYYPRRVYGGGAYSYRRAAPVRRKRVTTRRPVKRRRTVARRSIRTVSGSGAYRTKSNSLISKWVDNGPPLIKNAKGYDGGGIVLSNREYVTDINSGTGTPTSFDNKGYGINPGNSELFPWLSSIARNFDQYRFKGLIFEYKTLSVDALSSTTVNVGSVILSTDYNVYHGLFADKNHMENNMYACSGKPSQSIMHPVECAARETPIDKLYIRGDTPATDADLRLYDLATFQIASVGLPAPASSIGELWVSYEVP